MKRPSGSGSRRPLTSPSSAYATSDPLDDRDREANGALRIRRIPFARSTDLVNGTYAGGDFNFQRAGLVLYQRDDALVKLTHESTFETRQTEWAKEATQPLTPRVSATGTQWSARPACRHAAHDDVAADRAAQAFDYVRVYELVGRRRTGDDSRGITDARAPRAERTPRSDRAPRVREQLPPRR